MKKQFILYLCLISLSVYAKNGEIVFPFPGRFQPKDLGMSGFVRTGNKGKELSLFATKEAASITFRSPAKAWDLSHFVYLICEIQNLSSEKLLVESHLNGDYWSTGASYISAKSSRKFKTLILRKEYSDKQKKQFPRMNGLPGGALRLWCSYKPDSIVSISFDFPLIKSGDMIVIKSITLEKPYKEFSQAQYEKLLPLIDEYGQYKNSNYPGKIFSDKAIINADKKEDADLKKYPGNKDWNEFGGWEKGPQLKATGHFRVEKYNNKWWFVDPKGRLFWSQGITCVAGGDATSVKDRKNFYQYIPYENVDFKPFIKALAGDTSVSFLGINMFKKWGNDYEKKMIDKTNRRLKSWDINTIANWSNSKVIEQHKVPYTATLNTQYGHNPADPFSENFQEGFEKGIALSTAANDPWCIGYFVDNEIGWGDDTHLAVLTIKGTYKSAKVVFKNKLIEKYERLQDLNKAWGSAYSSWDDFIKSDSIYQGANTDMRAFTLYFANTLFKRIKAGLKFRAPDKLYLGCRFNYGDYSGNSTQRWIVDISSLYCDVVSFNRYLYSAFSLAPSPGKDFPMIIGEFHFGGLDRGLLHCGLRFGGDQDNRAELYANYVMDAVTNPNIIGAHWFQYSDQAVTGRGDGENYQIGFINVYDAPNKELIDAARQVGSKMYPARIN